MVIDLNSTNNPSISPRRAGADSVNSTPSSSEASNSPKSAASSSEVSISTEAQSMQRLEDAIEQSPEFDSARVEALRTAIENGDYSINADRIASAFIDSDNLGL